MTESVNHLCRGMVPPAVLAPQKGKVNNKVGGEGGMQGFTFLGELGGGGGSCLRPDRG